MAGFAPGTDYSLRKMVKIATGNFSQTENFSFGAAHPGNDDWSDYYEHHNGRNVHNLFCRK